MAVIVVGTNSYVTEAELTTYATDRGITILASDKTVLLIKSMDYIETRNFKGYKTDTDQALQFPRVITGYDSDEVPDGIKTSQIIAALLVDGGNDLQPTIEKAVKSKKVDVIEIEYQDFASESTTYTQLNDVLRPFVQGSGLNVVRA